jgi:mono/diheme cytochrome c family protein
MRVVYLAPASVGFILLGAAMIAWSGVVNVAALSDPSSVEVAILHPIMRQSVRKHANGIVTPADLSARAAKGSQDFAEMCATCHGAPGVERNEVGQGLNPQPPSLTDAVHTWTPSQIFWIVKNGVRMTGMPAFGPTHDDDRIWSIVAFVQKLHGMTPDQYAEATSSADASESRGHDHGNDGHTHDHPGRGAEQPHTHTHDEGK